MISQARPAMIEGLEQRVLFDASQLTETILSSTLAGTISDQMVLHGAVKMQVRNNSGTAQKFTGQLGIYASDQSLNLAGGDFTILRSEKAGISLASGVSKIYTFSISEPRGKFTDGTFMLFGALTDKTGASSQSPAGPTLVVHAPIVTLSETETFLKLPPSTAPGSKLHVTDRITISNSGTDPFAGKLAIALLASTTDTVSGAIAPVSVLKKLTIPAGKSVVVALSLKSETGLAPAAYRLISEVTQPNGLITTTDLASAPLFTIEAPIVHPIFVDTILSTNESYNIDSNDSSAEYLTQLDLAVGIQNNGTVADGRVQFTLLESNSPTLDSSAVQLSSLSLNLYVPSDSGQEPQIDFNIPGTGTGNSTVVNHYIFLEITDTAGDVTTASYPTEITFDGPGTT